MNFRETASLAGPWIVYPDPDDKGLEQGWYLHLPSDFSHQIELPGCLQEQGIGNKVNINTKWIGSQFDKLFYTDERYASFREDNNFKFPYWLQPESRYVGPVWYVREVNIPDEWSMNRLEIFLERPHWETRVWLDGVCLGKNKSLSVPHRYEVEPGITSGRKLLVIRVDNRMLVDVGPNAHSMSDHTQGNWNGIVGRMEIISTSPVYIRNVEVSGDVNRHSAMLRIEVANSGAGAFDVELHITSRQNCKDSPVPAVSKMEVGSFGSVIYREVCFDKDLPLWNEFSPSVIEIEVSLSVSLNGRLFRDSLTVNTGLREVKTGSGRILINGNPVFLRGTLECCVFPRTGYPPSDTESWRRIYLKAREYGLNHIRFHSWCPPEAAFTAADEEGFYLQIECPVWMNQDSEYNGNSEFDQWLYAESERIIREYGNHPSFIMFTSGNEPSGRIEEFLGLWVSFWKNKDGRRLYTTAAGWPALTENDYHNVPSPRIQAWGDGLSSRINAQPPETQTDYREICKEFDRVVVSHEIGQWCAYPNFPEIPKYTGYLKPKNYEIFFDFLKKNGLADQAEDFIYASGRLQVLCYKEEIESSLRTSSLAGFQLLGLTDFPGQGTSTVGVLDAFWEEKGYCTSGMFHEFCGPTVILARLPGRYYRDGDILELPVDIAHFGESALEDVLPVWSLIDDTGRTIQAGPFGSPKRC